MCMCRVIWIIFYGLVRAGSMFALSQWKTALLCNDVSHWLGACLESALVMVTVESVWWLLISWCLFDTRPSTTTMMWPGQPIWGVPQGYFLGTMFPHSSTKGKKASNIYEQIFCNGNSEILKYDWRLFPGIQLKISQRWLRYWLGAVQATGHCLNHWWHVSSTHICVTRPK